MPFEDCVMSLSTYFRYRDEGWPSYANIFRLIEGPKRLHLDQDVLKNQSLLPNVDFTQPQYVQGPPKYHPGTERLQAFRAFLMAGGEFDAQALEAFEQAAIPDQSAFAIAWSLPKAHETSTLLLHDGRVWLL